MSHVSDVKLKIKDIQALEQTIAEKFPHLEFRHKKTYAWWGRFVGDSTPPPGRDPKDYGKGEYAIGVKGVTPQNGSDGTKWEIGVVKALDGDGFDMMLDTYGSGRKLAEEVPALRREYAATVAGKKALETISRKGWRMAGREELPGNRIRLKLKKR